MSGEKSRVDWSVFVLPVIGLVTAIAQAITALRGPRPAPPPTQPRQPSAPPPVPPGRADAAITAEQHELVRQEAARRSTLPPPAPAPAPGSALRGEVPVDPDATEPDAPPSDPAIEPRDIQ
ncbi:hypothetical protein WMF30_10495 [Sorangium sp. So ce134]